MGLPYLDKVRKHKNIPDLDYTGQGHKRLGVYSDMILDRHLEYLSNLADERRIDDWVSLLDLHLTYWENKANFKQHGIDSHSDRVDEHQKYADNLDEIEKRQFLTHQWEIHRERTVNRRQALKEGETLPLPGHELEADSHISIPESEIIEADAEDFSQKDAMAW